MESQLGSGALPASVPEFEAIPARDSGRTGGMIAKLPRQLNSVRYLRRNALEIIHAIGFSAALRQMTLEPHPIHVDALAAPAIASKPSQRCASQVAFGQANAGESAVRQGSGLPAGTGAPERIRWLHE